MNLSKKAIRVGLAASLCFLASDLLKLKFPFFAILPAVMPISTFFGETIKFGINRAVGSTIGAVVGVLLAYIQSGNVLLVGLGVILIVYVCNYLKWDSSTSIACLVFAAIIVGVKEPSPIDYSVHRLLATFVGIAITTIVNNYVFNPDMSQLLKKQATNIQKSLLVIANNKDFSESKNKLYEIESELNSMKEKLRIYGEEFKLNKKFSHKKSKLETLVNTLMICFEQIKTISYINTQKNKEDSNETKLDVNSINGAIQLHKNIFFREMENLNNILSDIT
jgi:uncharacterized membrane protein YgaE (UPF0421/DUF939 family)